MVTINIKAGGFPRPAHTLREIQPETSTVAKTCPIDALKTSRIGYGGVILSRKLTLVY
jgi:hypothetical protein